jgi:cyclophilin family peptidyl-prolyl cis-trans isomerase
MAKKRRITIKSNNTTFKILIGIAIIIAILTVIFISKPNEAKPLIVTINTSMGNIDVELNESAAPITVANFLSYVDESFYNGLIFHRVIDGFMIQGGGMTSNGKQKTTKAPIILESSNGLKNDKGTIAMARTGDPNSATSQFFINTANNDFLNKGTRDDGYAVFGKVVSGMDVVDKIEKVQTKSNPQDWPKEQIIINSIKRK